MFTIHDLINLLRNTCANLPKGVYSTLTVDGHQGFEIQVISKPNGEKGLKLSPHGKKFDFGHDPMLTPTTKQKYPENYLSIELLHELTGKAIAAGRGKNPVFLSVDYASSPATTLSDIEDIDDAGNCCLMVRDDMKI